LPEPDAPGGYTWCKAPRLAGAVIEVGAMARQIVDGHPLISDLVARSDGNARTRIIARMLEIARIVPLMEAWVRAIRPREPFCAHNAMPEDGECEGLIEAARGALGHWMQVRDGRIANYQIVAPTTWNFSPRDENGIPGVCEQALVDAPVREGEVEPVAVQHIVRSFDPCMVCTVH
jgi:hydrogenase large subunit